MLILINSKIKKVYMIKILIIFIFLYTGCSRIEGVVLSVSEDNKQFSCSQKAKPKSLQFLEQQYRCTSQE